MLFMSPVHRRSEGAGISTGSLSAVVIPVTAIVVCKEQHTSGFGEEILRAQEEPLRADTEAEILEAVTKPGLPLQLVEPQHRGGRQ